MDFTPAPRDGGNALALTGYVSADAAEWLPPKAAERLRALRLRATDLHRAIPDFEARQAANLAKTECAQRLARLTAHRTEMAGTGFGYELLPNDPHLVLQTKKLAAATQAAERINNLYETRAAEWNAASRALVSVESWLKAGRPSGTVLQDYAGDAPKLKNGETLQGAILRFRKKIAEVQTEISDIERRPLLAAYCRQKAKAQIEMLAARGKPNARALVAGSLDVIQFASERHSHNLNGYDAKGKPITGVAAWEAPDLLGLFCHIHKAALILAVDAAIAAECVDESKAVAPDARERTLADLRVKLFQAELDDCAATFLAIFEQKLGQIESLPMPIPALCSPSS
jgi:hypothetical protein